LDARSDNTALHYSIKIDSRDLFEALSLDKDRDATDDEIRAGSEALYDYVEARLKIVLDADCRSERAPVRVVRDGTRFAELALDFQCRSTIGSVSVTYDLFFDLDALHVGLLRIGSDAIQLKKDDNLYVYEPGVPPPSGFIGFIRSGVDHILFGLDHVLFLTSLLLMVVIRREADSALTVRPLREQLTYTALIVTSFTIAHSVTLIAAALGWLTLPGALVESVIAASIVYVAVENVVRPDPPHRHRVTFVFGLIHGLGFASMLRPLLPDHGVVPALLAFNLGVELGQLAIVVVSLPFLFALAKGLHADRYRRWVLPTAALGLAFIGTVWFVERAFGLEILGL